MANNFLEVILMRRNLYIAICCFLFLIASFCGYQIKQAQAESGLTATSTALCNITYDLKIGMMDADVKELQKYLNENGFPLAQTGVGSKGEETTFFGTLTQSALSRFQKANNISTIYGFFNSATKDYLGCPKFKFNRDLKFGMMGNDVKELQKYLNSNGFSLAQTGDGSKGKETTFFGILTQNALKRFQVSKLKTTPNEAGNFQVDTRSYINGEQVFPSYILTYSAGPNGKIMGTNYQTVIEGGSGTAVTAVPDIYYRFINWTDGSTVNPRVDTNVTTNKLVTANFTRYYSGGGGNGSSSPSDTTAPVISSIATSSLSSTGVTITWTTDELSNSRVDYGTTVSYGTVSTSATLTTNHSITLTGLSDNTTYHYRVQSADAQVNTATSTDATFNTESDIAMLVETGSYTGTGTTSTTNINSSFKPDKVFVMPANTDPIMWRNRTVWHGRTQFLTDLPSAYAIGSLNGKVWEEFDGAGFTATGNANKSGVVYHWVAFNDNSSSTDQSSSWVGNAINPRSIQFTQEAADLMFIKRDSSRPSIFRWQGADNAVSGKFQDGTTTAFVSINDDGLTVTDAVTVNQNSNTALGEGIEGVGFYDGATSKLVTYTGDGTSNRLIPTGFEPNAVMILDGVNDNTSDTKHNIFVTDTMTVGEGKPFGAASMVSSAIGGLQSDGVRLATSDYNVSGRKYAILAFKTNTTNVVDEESFDLSVSDNGLINNGSTVTLENFPALSGTSTLEFFGRPQYGFGNRYLPLVMLGSAAPGTLETQGHTYNGGIYLYSTDPDSNGWIGPVLRIIHSDYLSRDRDEGSINYYNLNTGVPISWGKDIHILVTHNGNGHWQIYVNGEKVKDYNVNLNQATYGNRINGGTGTNKTVTLLSGASSVGSVGVSGRAYNVAVWNGVELTREDAQGRYESFLVGGENYSGPNPDKEYDFTGASVPIDVTTGGATLGPWTATRTQTPFFLGSGNASSTGVTTLETNGDVIVTTAVGDTNGRALFQGSVGKQNTIRTKLSYNNASRIILRYGSDPTGMTGTSIFDLTGTGEIDRTDTLTLPSQYLHYVGVTSAGQSFIIHPETSVTWE